MRNASFRRECTKRRNPGWASLRLIGAAFGITALLMPGTVLAGDMPGAGGIEVLLTSASNLTDGEMATQAAEGLHFAAPLPDVPSLRARVHLWDELAPTVAASLQNQSTTITIHTGH